MNKIKKLVATICLSAFLVILIDFLASGGAVFHFLLMKVGVPEAIISVFSFTFVAAYFLGECGCAWLGSEAFKRKKLR